jgi:hypothetical protein
VRNGGRFEPVPPTEQRDGAVRLVEALDGGAHGALVAPENFLLACCDAHDRAAWVGRPPLAAPREEHLPAKDAHEPRRDRTNRVVAIEVRERGEVRLLECVFGSRLVRGERQRDAEEDGGGGIEQRPKRLRVPRLAVPGEVEVGRRGSRCGRHALVFEEILRERGRALREAS